MTTRIKRPTVLCSLKKKITVGGNDKNERVSESGHSGVDWGLSGRDERPMKRDMQIRIDLRAVGPTGWPHRPYWRGQSVDTSKCSEEIEELLCRHRRYLGLLVWLQSVETTDSLRGRIENARAAEVLGIDVDAG